MAHGKGSPSRNEVTYETHTHARTTHHSNGTTSKSHSVVEQRNEAPPLPMRSEIAEPVQPSPVKGAVDDYEPGGNHYEMYDNGNGNSGPEACARYPRMTREIGGCEEGTGHDRIQLEHDDPLIHRR